MWIRKGHLWKMEYPKKIINRQIWENAIFAFMILIHIYRCNIWISMAYILSTNACYAISITPDHDSN